MNSGQISAVMEYVMELWPRTQWHDDVVLEFHRRLSNVDLSVEQVHACFMDFKMRRGLKRIEPSQLLKSLSGPLQAQKDKHDMDRSRKQFDRLDKENAEALREREEWTTMVEGMTGDELASAVSVVRDSSIGVEFVKRLSEGSTEREALISLGWFARLLVTETKQEAE